MYLFENGIYSIANIWQFISILGVKNIGEKNESNCQMCKKSVLTYKYKSESSKSSWILILKYLLEF